MPQTLSPARWLDVLERRLEARWFRSMGAYDAYYEGDHRLAFATSQFREAFGSLFSAMADNWCPIVIDAAVERLKVQGFRFGKQQSSDDRAWEIWQANGLDAESAMLHTEAVKLGEAYWLVEPPAAGSSNPPRITAEHPMQMIVATAPGDRRRRLAALKKWVDEDDGYVYATLYLPDTVLKYRSQRKAKDGHGRIDWQRRPGDEGGSNLLGEVPAVPLRNAPSMLAGGRSDLKGAIPIQDAINKLLSDMMIGSEYQAFPQRVLLGVEVPKDPQTGLPITAMQLQASQKRLWAFEGADAKVAEFKAADLDNYVKARKHIIDGFNAKTRTPPHYVLGEIVNASGDALTAAEAGLVARTEDKHAPFGEGHEDTMRLSFKALGDDQRAAQAMDAETLWAKVERRSFAQVVDGATKLSTMGVPDEIVWEELGWSPQKIARVKAMKIADELLNPPVPPPAPGTTTTTPPAAAGVGDGAR